MSRDEAVYFQKRAEEELEKAQRADHPGIVQAHYDLAGYYLDLLYGDGTGPPGDPSGPAFPPR